LCYFFKKLIFLLYIIIWYDFCVLLYLHFVYKLISKLFKTKCCCRANLQLFRLSVLFCSSWNRSSELVVGWVDIDVLDDGAAGQKGDVPRSHDDK